MLSLFQRYKLQVRLGGVNREGLSPKRVYPIFLIAFLVVTSSTNAQIADKWTLNQMVEYALVNSITVKQSELNLETANNNYTQSRASRLPSLSASGSQSLTKGTSTDPITYDFVSQTIHSTSVALSASMTLYGGGQINNSIKQNHLLIEQNSLYVEEAKNSITLSVTQGYMEALYYYEGVVIAQENLDASKTQLERSTALYDAGSIAAIDLAEIKSQYASDQYSLVSAQNNYNQQVLTLKQLLELEPDQSFELSIPDTELTSKVEIPDKYEVYRSAIENMPEIKSASLQQNIGELDLSIAKAGYKPTLSLSGSLSTGYTNTQDYSFSEQFDNNFNQRLGLSLSVPIFSKLQTKTSVQNAKISMQSAQLDLVSAKKSLYSNIENAHQSLTASSSELDAVKEQVDAAQTTYDLASQQYKLGLINSTDLLVDQNTLITAQQQYLQTKYRAVLYYSLLKFYAGEPMDIIQD